MSARAGHTSTLLASGLVLAAGGHNAEGDSLASAELYDPVRSGWIPTNALRTARKEHTATLLPDGRVLFTGGRRKSPLASAELYDPIKGRWTLTGALHISRAAHTATLLPDGKVLIVGGFASGRRVARSTELYDPATGRFAQTGALNTARAAHTATLLHSGRVLIAGGNDGDLIGLASAEVYDPATGRFTPSETLKQARTRHIAQLLPSGQVLIAGGCSDAGCAALESTEVYDPASGTWSPAGALTTGRVGHTSTLLPSGRVLLSGGHDGGSRPLSTTDLWESGTRFQDAWRPVITSVTPIAVGAAVGVLGNLFQGISEASGGNSGQHSATNYPFVQLSRQDNGQTILLPLDPVAGWSDTTFTSLPLPSFPAGPASLTVIANGIPSVAQSVIVGAATPVCPGCGEGRYRAESASRGLSRGR
jgi:hypothetical protein